MKFLIFNGYEAFCYKHYKIVLKYPENVIVTAYKWQFVGRLHWVT